MYKKISLLFFLLLFSPAAVFGNEIVDAGFIKTLWFSNENFIINEKTRIYSAIENNTAHDLMGKIQLYDNDKLINEAEFSLAQSTTLHHWFDFTITTGTHALYERLIEVKKTRVGKPLEQIFLRSSTSSVSYKQSLPPTSSNFYNVSTSTTTSETHLITVFSDEQAVKNNSSTFSSTSSSSQNSSSTVIKKATSQTKTIIEKITGGIVPYLENKKESLDKEIQDEKNHEPVKIFEDTAKQIENKTTFLKIPRDKIPSFKQLQSLFLGLAIFILHTWWIVAILFGLVIWNIVRLWRYIHRSKY